MPILAMRCHQVSILKIPILWSLQRPDNKLSEEEAKFNCLTVGVRKFFGKFLLGKETFEVEQSLPHQQANQEVPSSSVVRHGYPLFLSSLHLLQDLQLLWQDPYFVRSSLGVFHHPGPAWPGTTLLQDGTDCFDSNHQVNCNVPYNCQRLEMWLRSQVWNASILTDMLEVALDPPCWVHPRAKLVIKIKLN